jgi:hypothetical protein
LDFHPIFSGSGKTKNENLEFSYKIKNNDIELICTLNNWNKDYVTEIYKCGHDIIRSVTSLVTFSNGNPLYVHFNRFVDPNGQESPLAVMNPDLAELCTVFTLNNELGGQNLPFDNIMQIVLTDPALFLALSDLSLAISNHDHIATGCARAVEGIRLMIWGSDTTTTREAKASWTKLQVALRASEQYLKLITENSKGARHGSRRQ